MPLATSLPPWLGILSRVKSLFLVRQHDIPTLGIGRMTKCYLHGVHAPVSTRRHCIVPFLVSFGEHHFFLVGLLPHCSSFFILGMVRDQ